MLSNNFAKRNVLTMRCLKSLLFTRSYSMTQVATNPFTFDLQQDSIFKLQCLRRQLLSNFIIETAQAFLAFLSTVHVEFRNQLEMLVLLKVRLMYAQSSSEATSHTASL
ncbi:MAG: Uncharacterised protein [Opitutia bacterium UBA7350]|nr:MAG: Uncharacterised protein [Opitutae bacterium UBA7350]